MDNGAISKVKANILDNSKHIKILDTKSKPNQLEICGKQATQNSNNLQNKFDLPSFKCEMCPYESIWKHAVKRHQQTHNRGQISTGGKEGSKKSKYKCETCSYTTNNWTILKDHQKLHTSPNRNVENDEHEDLSIKELQELEERNKTLVYTCKTCKYQTNHRAILESHKKVHLPRKGDEVFRCDWCSFNSVYRQSLLRHTKTMHENELSKTEGDLHSNYSGITSVCKDQIEEYTNMEKDHMKKKFDHNGKKITYSEISQNNNIIHKKVTSNEITSSTPCTDPPLKTTQIQKGILKTRRGKYSDVPVKTTKNGLFECEHCSYQTAIRTALVKHQKNHLKNANS